MRIALQILVLSLALAMVGCASMPSEYRPDTVGSLEDADIDDEIEISISPRDDTAYIGHPIVFNLNIGGSLPEFFESMFLTGSFEESILEQIKTNSLK